MAAAARYEQEGYFQAADEAFQTSGYCGCYSQYVPGQGLFVAHRCTYYGGQQDGVAEEWQWYDDPYKQSVGFDSGEYQTGFECRNWDVDDSNEMIRKEFDRRRATVATTYACTEGTDWSHRWMLTSERSMLPAYVVLITLMGCMLIAIGVVNILPSIEEGVSTESVAAMPFLTQPTMGLADVTVRTPADNNSYTTDVHYARLP
ncbi:hypothetical protein MTO96_019928 [Rhipicephalus appendiculatus]